MLKRRTDARRHLIARARPGRACTCAGAVALPDPEGRPNDLVGDPVARREGELSSTHARGERGAAREVHAWLAEEAPPEAEVAGRGQRGDP